MPRSFRLLFLLGCLFLLPLNTSAQVRAQYVDDPPSGIRPFPADMKHLLLDVELFPEEKKVKGTAQYTFQPLALRLDSLFLDGPGIQVTDVRLNQQTQIFRHTPDSSGIWMIFNPPLNDRQEYTLTLQYQAFPPKGIYFTGWNDPKNQTRKQIWTQGQGVDNRYWIPSFDDMSDKLTTEIRLSFDSRYQVLSNGILVSKKPGKDNKTFWHYRMTKPHAPYLLMLAIGEYAVAESKTKRGVNIYNWYYPNMKDRVAPTYRYTAEMIDWMDQEFGVNYPWEQYSQVPVQDFMYGAMENTMATIFGDFSLIDERAYLDRWYVSTNAHELVHQWFGDYVTARSIEHVWLQESFATHYQKHFEKSIFGEDHFQWNRRNELRSVLDAAKNDQFPIVHTKAGTPRIYPKGSLVLDMLRYVLGDEAYKKAVTHFLKKFPYGLVDTHDFYIAFHEALGENLDVFFKQWLYQGGEPHYVVSYEIIRKVEGEFVQVNVRQAHPRNEYVGLFDMPIVMEAHFRDGSKQTIRERNHLEVHHYLIPIPEGKTLDFVVFDPNHQMVKTLEFRKSPDEWQRQAVQAPNMIDRYDALLALRSLAFQGKYDFLINAYNRETFYGNQALITEMLLDEFSVQLPASILMSMVRHPHASVRKAVANYNQKINIAHQPAFEILLKDSSYEVIEKSRAALCRSFPDKAPQYLRDTKDVKGVGNSVLAAWYGLHWHHQRDSTSLNALIDMCGNSWEFRSRVNAIRELKKIFYLNETMARNLLHAAVHFNRRLGREAEALLKTLSEKPEYREIIRQTARNQSFTHHETALLRTFFGEWPLRP